MTCHGDIISLKLEYLIQTWLTYLRNSVVARSDLDLPILAALFECVHYRRAIIFTAAGSHRTERATLDHTSEC